MTHSEKPNRMKDVVLLRHEYKERITALIRDCAQCLLYPESETTWADVEASVTSVQRASREIKALLSETE